MWEYTDLNEKITWIFFVYFCVRWTYCYGSWWDIHLSVDRQISLHVIRVGSSQNPQDPHPHWLWRGALCPEERALHCMYFLTELLFLSTLPLISPTLSDLVWYLPLAFLFLRFLHPPLLLESSSWGFVLKHDPLFFCIYKVGHEDTDGDGPEWTKSRFSVGFSRKNNIYFWYIIWCFWFT